MNSTATQACREQSKQARLAADSILEFHCSPGLRCFTACCHDVNIFLTPYDILRIKGRLGISSEEFLHSYALELVPESTGFPLVALKMQDERDKACPFLGPEGCSIYEDRPWSCRMYPLDRGERDGEYRLIAKRSLCMGMESDRQLKVSEYLREQGVDPYNEMEKPFQRIVSHPRLSKERLENPKIREMCRLALYDLDRFKRFVFESRFLSIFFVEREEVERIRQDESALMDLAFRWLEFGLLDGTSLKIREDVLQNRKSEREDV